MVCFESILLIGSALGALAVSPRSAQTDEETVFRSLLQIDTDTQSFTQTVQQWNGDPIYALGLYTAQRTLEQDVATATNDTLALNQTVSEDLAQAAIDWITNTLQPDVDQSFQELISRKADFDKSNLTYLVVDGLQDFRDQAANLSNALVAKAPADKVTGAKEVAASFAQEFADALKAFQS